MSQIDYKVVVRSHATSWYKPNTDILHRIDGPAAEYKNGYKEWYFEDKFHRVDGPAIEFVSGEKQWWLNGKLLTEAEHKALTAQKPTCDGKIVEIDGQKYKLTLV